MNLLALLFIAERCIKPRTTLERNNIFNWIQIKISIWKPMLKQFIIVLIPY